MSLALVIIVAILTIIGIIVLITAGAGESIVAALVGTVVLIVALILSNMAGTYKYADCFELSNLYNGDTYQTLVTAAEGKFINYALVRNESVGVGSPVRCVKATTALPTRFTIDDGGIKPID